MNRRAALTTVAGFAAIPWAARADRAPLYNLDELVADMGPVDLSDMVLSRVDGSPEAFDVHAGRLVILNLWATWCPPCVWELPSLGRLADALSDRGLTVIAASVENGGPDAVRRFLVRQPISGPLFRHMGMDGMGQFMVIGSLPTTFIVLPDMTAVARVDQPIQWDTPEVRRRVARWLDQHVPA